MAWAEIREERSQMTLLRHLFGFSCGCMYAFIYIQSCIKFLSAIKLSDVIKTL